MCGRYLFIASPEMLQEEYGLEALPGEMAPRYNIAPSQTVPVVGRKPHSTARGLAGMRWGLVPRWAKSQREGPRPINARSETIRTSPVFRESFKQRRGLMPASGFYEWQQTDEGKRPYVFRPAGPRPLLSFAAIWDQWQGEQGELMYTCAIITVPANAALRAFHERMPAILTRERYEAWLDPAATAAEALELLAPTPDDFLRYYRVSPLVNKVQNDTPECLAPAA